MHQSLAFLVTIIFCGDVTTDLLYLIFNWNSFANQILKYSALTFTSVNAAMCLFVSFYLLSLLKGLRNDQTKLVIMLCCFGWVPVVAFLFLIVWGKLTYLMDSCECLDNITENKEDLKKFNNIITVLTYIQIFI